MIFYNDNLKEQIKEDCKELEDFKDSYSKRISLYNVYIETIKMFGNYIDKDKLNQDELENKINFLQTQINKIESNMFFLNNLLKSTETTEVINLEENELERYNQEYKEIRNNYITNSVYEEQITANYINVIMTDFAKTIENMKEKQAIEIKKIIQEKTNNQLQGNQTKDCVEENINQNGGLKNNNTLLISEKTGKVVLPYRAEEVEEIFNREKDRYASYEDVIKDKFIRDFSDYKVQFASRYNETMKLARNRENYGFLDAVMLSAEMMKKRFLHPAIITACKNLNELDVYLDCLDKNELEDFKIFKIEYELYPMVVKHNKKKF